MEAQSYERIERVQRFVYAALLLALLYGAVLVATAPAYR